jgi:nitroimidazol reductase NimA-like FMN-containing flavoprotein (pyridoxamine 5'-phosphate oxidase superfamily)
MRADIAAMDPVRLARTLIAQNSYLTLATADPDGVPWAAPVWFAATDLETFVWASSPAARHSRNIAENPRVALVIFDSSKPPGEGSALYLAGDAELVSAVEFEDALAVYNTRSVERGLRAWEPGRLRDPAKHRLYRAAVREAFVLDDHDERIAVRISRG